MAPEVAASSLRVSAPRPQGATDDALDDALQSEACHTLVQYLRDDSTWTVATAVCLLVSEKAVMAAKLGA